MSRSRWLARIWDAPFPETPGQKLSFRVGLDNEQPTLLDVIYSKKPARAGFFGSWDLDFQVNYIQNSRLFTTCCNS